MGVLANRRNLCSKSISRRGDLLYLPRGYVHTTTTSASYSAHVTVGIAVYTWLDLAGELLQSSAESVRSRRALPPGFAHRADPMPVLKEGLEEVLGEQWEDLACGKRVETFLARVRSNNVPTRGRSERMSSSLRLIPDSAVQGLRSTSSGGRGQNHC